MKHDINIVNNTKTNDAITIVDIIFHMPMGQALRSLGLRSKQPTNIEKRLVRGGPWVAGKPQISKLVMFSKNYVGE